MAKIYSAPEEIKVPDFWESTEEDNKNYVDSLRTYIKEKGYAGKHAGKVIEFSVADGYAKYMVVSTKPVALMHIPLDDAYEYHLINRIKASDINKDIAMQMSSPFFKSEFN